MCLCKTVISCKLIQLPLFSTVLTDDHIVVEVAHQMAGEGEGINSPGGSICNSLFHMPSSCLIVCVVCVCTLLISV